MMQSGRTVEEEKQEIESIWNNDSIAFPSHFTLWRWAYVIGTTGPVTLCPFKGRKHAS